MRAVYATLLSLKREKGRLGQSPAVFLGNRGFFFPRNKRAEVLDSCLSMRGAAGGLKP